MLFLYVFVYHTGIEKIYRRLKSGMSTKTLISLKLSEAEISLLTELSERKEMSKSAVLRQALRIMGVD